MTYAGRVYDGPLEGEHLAHDRPYFEFNLMPAAWLHPVWSSGEMVPPDARFYRCLYRWSNPLRAWVFDWSTAPQPKPEPAKKPRKRALTAC